MSEILKEIFGCGPSLSDRWSRVMRICFHPSNEDRLARAWIHGFMVLTMLIVSFVYFYNDCNWQGSTNIVWSIWNGIACRENMNSYRQWLDDEDAGEA